MTKITIVPSAPAIEIVTLEADHTERWLAIAQFQSESAGWAPDLGVIDEDFDVARVFQGSRNRSAALMLSRSLSWVMDRYPEGERRRDRLDSEGLFVSDRDGAVIYVHACGEEVVFGRPTELITCLQQVQGCAPLPRGFEFWRHEDRIKGEAGLT